MAANAFAVAANYFDPPPDDDRDIAEACAASLSRFVREAWPLVEPMDPLIAGWHVDVICEHLEAVSAGELKRLIINIPPRSTKSLTVAVFWPAWEWLRSPHVRWLFASYAERLSTRDSLKCRRVIKSQGGPEVGTIFQRLGYQGVLKLLGTPWELTNDQDAKTRFENTATGFRLATSVGAMATGEGGNRLVVDDPLNPKQSVSDTQREAANEWWDGTMSSRFNNPDSTAVVVMQRLHEDDLTGHLLEKGGWHHLCLPAEYEPKHPFVYPDKVELPSGRELAGDPRTEQGELLEPVRLGPDTLQERRKDQGSYGYAGQFQQLPSPQEGGMLKRGWWQRYKLAQLPAMEKKIIAWDLTFGGDSQSSWSVGQVWGMTGADMYLIDQVRGQWPFEEIVRQIAKLANEHTAARPILIERAAAGEPAIRVLKRKIPGIVGRRPEGSKEVRVEAVAPYIEAGNVHLPDTEWVDGLIEECAVFPNGVNDDQCLVASTQVETPVGFRRLDEIRAGDTVRGASGWVTVLAAGQTGVSPVISAVGLTGTAEHPVWTEEGWKCLSEVVADDTIWTRCVQLKGATASPRQKACVSCTTSACETTATPATLFPGRSRSGRCAALTGAATGGSSSKDSAAGTITDGSETGRSKHSTPSRGPSGLKRWFTTALRSDGIPTHSSHPTSATSSRGVARWREVWSRFIARFTKTLLAPYRRATTSTISTGTTTTTTRATLSPSLPEPTRSITIPKGSQLRTPSVLILTESDHLPPLGIHRRRAGHGIESTPSEPVSGAVPVFNLATTDGTYFANGVLVHNCDALSMAISRLTAGVRISVEQSPWR